MKLLNGRLGNKSGLEAGAGEGHCKSYYKSNFGVGRERYREFANDASKLIARPHRFSYIPS